MLKVIEEISSRVLLSDGSEADTEGYRLENGLEVFYIGGKWVDPSDNEYTPVQIGSIVGFNRIATTDELSPYGEYNRALGGDRMPSKLIPEGDTEDGIYAECLQRGISWEELLSSYVEGNLITRVHW